MPGCWFRHKAALGVIDPEITCSNCRSCSRPGPRRAVRRIPANPNVRDGTAQIGFLFSICQAVTFGVLPNATGQMISLR